MAWCYFLVEPCGIFYYSGFVVEMLFGILLQIFIVSNSLVYAYELTAALGGYYSQDFPWEGVFVLVLMFLCIEIWRLRNMVRTN